MRKATFKFNEEVIVPGSFNMGCSQDMPAKVVKDDGSHTVFVRMLARCEDCDCCQEHRWVKRHNLQKKEVGDA